jgi:KxDL motif-containing protein 1
MAETTPDSELGSIECFQNYTAPEVFVQGLAGLVNQQDVESMIRAQKQMYENLYFY